MSEVQDKISWYLAKALKEKGYEAATPSMLNFLGALECGENYGSEIARNLGVSRQMVAKTVKTLCQMGFLERVSNEGKQKSIVFTELGERLMSDSRQLLADLDQVLMAELGEKTLMTLLKQLEKIKTLF